MLGPGLALAMLSSLMGLKVLKRGRWSSMGSPVPGSKEKWAQGSEASLGAPSWPCAPSLPMGHRHVGGFHDTPPPQKYCFCSRLG